MGLVLNRRLHVAETFDIWFSNRSFIVASSEPVIPPTFFLLQNNCPSLEKTFLDAVAEDEALGAWRASLETFDHTEDKKSDVQEEELLEENEEMLDQARVTREVFQTSDCIHIVDDDEQDDEDQGQTLVDYNIWHKFKIQTSYL